MISEEHSADTSEPPSNSSAGALSVGSPKDEVEGQQNKPEKGLKKGKATKMKKNKTLEIGGGTKVDQIAKASADSVDNESRRPIATAAANRANTEQKEVEVEGEGNTSVAAGRTHSAGGGLPDSQGGIAGSLNDNPSVGTVIEWRAESEVLAWITSVPLPPKSESRGSSLVSFSIGAHTCYPYYH